MIRPFTALCVLLAGSSGLYLYTEKHRTTVLDEQISKIVQDTQHIRERTAMLRAEWALLNQPDRLHALSTRFLPDLQPMVPNQFVQMAALSRRLPEIAAPVTIPISAAAPALVPAPAVIPAPAPILAPADATVLAPIQVMARRLAPAASEPAVIQSSGSAAIEAVHHPVQHGHAPIRLVASSHPAPASTMQASRTVAYEGSPVRSLISTAGAYTHPSPVQTSARRPTSHATGTPTIRAPYAQPSYIQSSYARSSYPKSGTVRPTMLAQAAGTQSLLGFSHVALPAPVPFLGN